MDVRATDPDLGLLQRIARADGAAWTDLVGKYTADLFRFLAVMERDQATIEDVIQQTWLKAWRSIDSFGGTGLFKAWLFRIAVNTWREVVRKPSRLTFVPDYEALPSQPTTIDEQSEYTGLLEQINHCLKDAPDKIQTAFVLRHVNGFEYQEIAITLGVTEARARGLVYEATIILRERLPR